MDKLQHDEVVAEAPITQEFDVAGNLLDGVLVVPREVPSDAQKARTGPVHALGHVGTEFFHHEPLKVFSVIEEPIKIEQSLAPHILVYGSFMARLYSMMTGEPSSSIPKVSIRPPWIGPVEYSLARNLTPSKVSRLASNR